MGSTWNNFRSHNGVVTPARIKLFVHRAQLGTANPSIARGGRSTFAPLATRDISRDQFQTSSRYRVYTGRLWQSDPFGGWHATAGVHHRACWRCGMAARCAGATAHRGAADWRAYEFSLGRLRRSGVHSRVYGSAAWQRRFHRRVKGALPKLGHEANIEPTTWDCLRTATLTWIFPSGVISNL